MILKSEKQYFLRSFYKDLLVKSFDELSLKNSNRRC